MYDDEPENEPEVQEFNPDFLPSVMQMPNIAEHLDDRELALISGQVCSEYDLDDKSMTDWRDQMKRGIDLAKLVKEDKSYPFKNASNIKYPLITSAALQFNARAYAAIVPSDRIVKCKTYGADQMGQKAARAERVSEHMSWDLSVNMDEWEEETDKLLVQLPIVGTMVRKVWYDVSQGRKRCRVAEPGAFVVNNKVRNLNDAPRASELIPLYPHEIDERVKSGEYLDCDMEIDEDSQGSEDFIEQHTRWDLDDDGYSEPYIVTVHKRTQKVVRMVADFEERDIQWEVEQALVMTPMGPQPQEYPVGVKSIRRGSYFIPYHFLPSLDGGFYGTGLGLLLGDISDTVNTIINMMLDAGHRASAGGGFIGSDLRLKGGSQRMQPGEWKPVPAKGNDIRASIVPLTFPQADGTLFQLLGLLIDAGKELASIQDVMTGDTGGRQQTATTTLALIEQGMQVFTAVYKRIFRSLKREFRLMAEINAQTVTPEEYNRFHDDVDQNGQPVMYDPAQDYSAEDFDIEPVADPRAVTKMQEMAKAQLVMEMAQAGLAAPAAASDRIAQAADIPDREELIPQPSEAEQMLEELQMQGVEADLALKLVDVEKRFAEIQKLKSETAKNMTEADATVANTRWTQIEGLLNDQRERIGLAIDRASGRVEKQPGNAGSQRPSGPPIPASPLAGIGGVLGQEPMAPGGY